MLGALPDPPLEAGGGGGPLQQRRQPFGQGLLGGAIEGGGQQQGLGLGAGGHQGGGPGQLVDGIDVAVELPLLGQQVFHQRPVEWIPFQPTQKQLAEGAQGGQRVAELVHEQLQLVVLLGQGAAEPLLLQVQAQGLGEAAGRGLQALGQGLGPGPHPAVHPQGADQLGPIAQGQPATGDGLGQGGQLQGGGVGAGD